MNNKKLLALLDAAIAWRDDCVNENAINALVKAIDEAKTVKGKP